MLYVALGNVRYITNRRTQVLSVTKMHFYMTSYDIADDCFAGEKYHVSGPAINTVTILRQRAPTPKIVHGSAPEAKLYSSNF